MYLFSLKTAFQPYSQTQVTRQLLIALSSFILLIAVFPCTPPLAAEPGLELENDKNPDEKHDIHDILSTINTEAPGASEALVQQAEAERKRFEAERMVSPPPKLTPVFDRIFEHFEENMSWGGYFRNETAFRIVRPAAFAKVLNIIQLENRYRFSGRTSLSGRGQCFYDHVYDIERVDVVHPRKGPEQILEGNLDDAAVAAIRAENVRDIEIVQKRCDLKELYLDTGFDSVDLRIGKQIVRWGVVEGARVTDEINPLDFYELILRDIEDRYIPLFMIKTDFYYGQNTLETLFIPEVRGHRPAPKGTQWEQFRELPGLVKPEDAWQDIPNHLGNAEYAFRYTRVFTGFELSASYFSTWDDFPASFRTFESVIKFAANPEVIFKPDFTRLKIYGTTFSMTFPNLIFNAEAAYVDGKHFGARFGEDSSALQGEIQSDYVKYAVGIDTHLFGMDISPAFIQQYIIDYDERIIVDRIETVAALFLRKVLLHNVWTLNLLAIYFINNEDMLIRPRSDYNLSDRLRFSFGVDIFEGNIGTGQPGEFNFAGFFDNNDRIFWEITYSF